MSATDLLATRIHGILTDSLAQLPLIEEIVSGRIRQDDLRRLAATLYAEARGSLQVKIPERIRICPIEATSVRRLWWHLLEEESGDFKQGRDHASLLIPICDHLGVSLSDRETAYDRHVATVAALCSEPVSAEMTVRQLAQTYVDEAALAHRSDDIADALHRHFGVPERALFYFKLHSTVDIEHSASVLAVLAEFSLASGLSDLAIRTVQNCLDRFPIWIDGQLA